jgi:hypothetical protein
MRWQYLTVSPINGNGGLKRPLYSALKLLSGLAILARIDWTLTVTSVISSAADGSIGYRFRVF